MTTNLLRMPSFPSTIGQGALRISKFDDNSDEIEPFPYRDNVLVVARTVATPISMVVPRPDLVDNGHCFYFLEDDGVVAVTLIPGVSDLVTTINGVNGAHVLGVIGTRRLTFIYTHSTNYSVLSVPIL